MSFTAMVTLDQENCRKCGGVYAISEQFKDRARIEGNFGISESRTDALTS